MAVNSTKAALGPERLSPDGTCLQPVRVARWHDGRRQVQRGAGFADLMMDQLGSKAMEVALVGFLPSLELPLAEYTLSGGVS